MKKIMAVLFCMMFVAVQVQAADVYKTFGCGITKTAFLKALGKDFSNKNGVDVKVIGKGGAGKAVILAGKGKVDFSAGCRPPLDIKSDKNTMATHVAWGALVFVVNPTNSVDNISFAQARDILTGKITNWKDVGGADKSINLYIRKGKNSGVGYSTRMLLFNNANQDYSSTPKKIVASSGPIRRAVAKDVAGFGVDDIASAHKAGGLKILKVDNMIPGKDTIASGDYGLYRPLYLYTNKSNPSAKGEEFLAYALSAAGQKTISMAGTVNLAEGEGLKVRY